MTRAAGRDRSKGTRGRGTGLRGRLWVIAGAMALQGLLLGLAVFIGVMEPPVRKAETVRIPVASEAMRREAEQEARRQAAELNRLQEASLKALEQPLLDSMRPELDTLPAPDPAQSLAAMGAMLPVGTGFNGATEAIFSGFEAEALPPPDPVEFLGEQLQAQRIVLLLDVSGSVKTKMERAGVSMDRLKEEVRTFINQLGPNHLFGIIQFTRNWKPFRDELVPGTVAMREEAVEWVRSRFRTTGTSGRNWNRGQPNGVQGVLQAAFAMDPQIDEIFLVSDGDFQRTPPGGGGQDVPWPELRQLTRSLQEASIKDARLRVLAFYPPQEARQALQGWVRENGPGSLRIVE